MKSCTKVIQNVPQLVYELLFDRLIIGPTQYEWAMCEAFRKALDGAGVSPETDRQRIFVSGIPIRS
jgi:hypothetical protein